MLKAELNDAKDTLQQLKDEQMYVKQQLEKDAMEKMRSKDEELAKLKKELIAKEILLTEISITVKRYANESEDRQRDNQ